MRQLIVPLATAALLSAALWTVAAGQSADVLAGGGIDSSFESWTGSGFAGWSIAGGSLAVAGPVQAGTSAAHAKATGPGNVVLSSKFWLVDVVEGVEYTLRAWVYDDDPSISGLTIELELTNSSGGRIGQAAPASLLGNAATYQQLSTSSLTATAGAVHLRVTIIAIAAAADAAFHVDSVTVEATAPPPPTPTATPTPTPTPTPAPTGTSTATPSPSPSPTATAAPNASPTASPSPTATGTASPTPTAAVTSQLVNGDFSAGTAGWAKVGGTLSSGSGFSDSGLAAVLTSQSGSTKWIHQTVLVAGGGWYEASARLRGGTVADRVLIRIAWYASADGSGSQLSTVDSPLITGSTSALVEVTTGATRAPLSARSAKLRLVLRPGSAAFSVLVADDVRFIAVAAPLATTAPTPSASPTPTPTASPTSTASPTATPSAASTATAIATSTPAATATAAPRATATAASTATSNVVVAASTQPAEQRGGSDVAAPRATGSGSLIRITELMPDPPEEGRDADFEWVELANVGTVEVSLAGYVLRDNGGEVALPNFSLPPGAVLVIAAPLARVEGAVAYRLSRAIGNGLANGGDRLALFTAGGVRVDALSYGSDRTYLREGATPLPAPGAGKSLRRDFADDGSLISEGVSDQPSPGVLPEPLVTGPANEDAQPSDASSGTNRMAWLVLTAIAVVALAAAGGLRLRELLSDEDG